jgi:hypothetical protein
MKWKACGKSRPCPNLRQFSAFDLGRAVTHSVEALGNKSEVGRTGVQFPVGSLDFSLS